MGMNQALRFGKPYEFVGFWDAGLATALEAIPGCSLREIPHLQIVFRSRARLLGHAIHCRSARHYLGRLFATFASLTRGLLIYDTQCGAKIFRVSPAVQHARATLYPQLARRFFYDS